MFRSRGSHPVNGPDVGIYLQTPMLLSVEHSLVSCAQDALAFYSDTILEYLEISEENTLLCGISFGDEDEPSGTE